MNSLARLRRGLRPVAPVLACLLLGGFRSARAADRLPDMITLPEFLEQNFIDTTEIPGRVLLRLSNATPNIGMGPLEIEGREPIATAQRRVIQRIYRDDGSSWERPAGTFTYHPSHDHVHFDDWAIYRLREIAPDGGVGAVVAQGAKTSFCLTDLEPYDPAHPRFGPDRYTECEVGLQGISPGWTDVYGAQLPDQWIDVTDVAPGHYWLEAEVDPGNAILEENEANNLSRIEVTLEAGEQETPIEPDRFEDNDTAAQVDGRDPAAASSPNLGTFKGPLVLTGLSIESRQDDDFFKFHLEDATAPGGFLRIESSEVDSDLDLDLLGAGGGLLGRSESSTNTEQIPLDGLAPGDYYARVFAFDGANRDYRLTIRPLSSVPPQLELLAPTGVVWVEQALETAHVAWRVSHHQGRHTSVSLAFDRDRRPDKATIPLLGYEQIAATGGAANVNTVGLGVGKWFVRATAMNEQGSAGAWAAGSFFVYRKGDIDFDGEVGLRDWRVVSLATQSGRMPLGWQHVVDMDRDGDVDARDLRLLWQVILEHVRQPHEH